MIDSFWGNLDNVLKWIEVGLTPIDRIIKIFGIITTSGGFIYFIIKVITRYEIIKIQFVPKFEIIINKSKDNDLKKFEEEEERSYRERKKLLSKLKIALENLITIDLIVKRQKLIRENYLKRKIFRRQSKENADAYKRLPLNLQIFGQLKEFSELLIILILLSFYNAYSPQINVGQVIVGFIAVIVIVVIFNKLGYIYVKNWKFSVNEQKSENITNMSLHWSLLVPSLICFTLMLWYFIIGSIILICYCHIMSVLLFYKYKKGGKFRYSLGYVMAKWSGVIIVIFIAYFSNNQFDYSNMTDVTGMKYVYSTITLRIITHALYLYADEKIAKFWSDDGIEELINKSLLLNILPRNRTNTYIQKLIDIIIKHREIEKIEEAIALKKKDEGIN